MRSANSGTVSKIREITYEDLERFWKEFAPAARSLASLQEVAQAFAEALFARFKESIVLTRVFATVTLDLLPPRDRAFAQRFAAEHGVTEPLSEATSVLSLLGTCGEEPRWNDRANSADHLAIPLVSEAFVGAIPMISRLLGEIGFEPLWESTANAEFVTKALANVNGIFYVTDARTTVDERDRKIIPAQDFVNGHAIRTVFGFGGSYLSQAMFITVIVFSRETILRMEAMKFVPLISSLKAGTTRLIKRGEIFPS